MKYFLFIILVIFIASCSDVKNKGLEEKGDPRLDSITLPAGFRISIFADSVVNARSLAMGTNGTIFVGSRNAKSVYALVDADNDGVAEKKYTIAEGLNSPNGVAFHNGSLYIAEISKISRIDNIESTLENPAKPVVVFDSLPDKTHHGWKYIAFGPDGKLYVPVGAPCNICDDNEKDTRFASIIRMNPDGTGFEVFAHGIRNTVGFTWDPHTGNLWFTDNGRDQMGDDVPPDELNVVTQAGQHFGYPYCHAGTIKDPELNKSKDCGQFVQPVKNLSPHGAALGLKFISGSMFPAEYQNQLIIAEHGSWNRSKKIGYRLMLAKRNGNTVSSYEPFAQGWMQNEKAWGRPVDVLQLKDGSLLVSDDHANVVYRITYNANGR